MTTAEILLKVSSDVEGIRKVSDAFAASKEQARLAALEIKNSRNALSGFGEDFKRTVATSFGIGAGFAAGAVAANVLLGAVRSVTNVLKDSITEGVLFNSTLEQAGLGVAAVLKQFNPEKYRDFRSAVAASADVIDQLKKKALETPATFEELLTAYQGTAGAMASAGIPLGKQVGLIVNISQAMGALGIRTAEMRQEATALLMGNIDRNARLAQMAGITADQIKAQKEQGRLYEFLTEKLKSYADAASLAAGTTEVLQSNLKDSKTQVAADQTKELSFAYKALLGSMTTLTQSSAYKETLNFLSKMGGLGVLTLSMRIDGLTSDGLISTVKEARGTLKSFTDQAYDVRSQSDIDAARKKGKSNLLNLESQYFEANGNRHTDGPANKSAEIIEKIYNATKEELSLLERNGQLRVENNLKAERTAELELKATNLAREAQKEREEGAKKYADASEKAQARIRAAAKATDEAHYLDLLKADKAALEKSLVDPRSLREHYLSGNDDSDPAKVEDARKAASAYRLELSGKLALVEKEIELTEESRAKKTKAEQERREKAGIKFLQVKAQEGTLEEKITTLNAEKNALDKTDLDYKADALTIEMRIARLKDDEAARLRTEISEAQQREQQAEINRIKGNDFLTERQKKEALYTAFKREQREIAEKIAVAEALVKTQSPGTAGWVQAEGDLRTLRTRQEVGLPQDLQQNAPRSMTSEIGAAMTQLQDGFRTVASSIADVMGGAIGGISDGIQGLLERTMTLGQAANAVFIGLGQSAIKAVSDMAAQWAVKHTLMAAVSAIFRTKEIAGTVLAEGTKTAVTVGGSAARITATNAETGPSLIQAGVKAMSAVANIPYAGPFLAIAALAAVIGAGLAVMRKGFATGGYTERGNREEPAGTVHKGEWVAPKWMVENPRFGNVIAGLEAERKGGRGFGWGGFTDLLAKGAPRWMLSPSQRWLSDRINLKDGTMLYGKPQAGGSSVVMDTRTDAQRALTDDMYVASGASAVGRTPSLSANGSESSAAASSASESGQVNIGYFNTRQDVETWLASQRGRRVMIDFIRQQKTEL